MTATLRSIAQMRDAGLVPASRAAALEQVAARYAVAITPAMAALIDRDDPNDPIARQFIPDPAELVTAPQERTDPIGDDAFSPVEGIVHRYPDRVLLKLVYTCPVYCRFCFRREMVGPNGRPGLTARQRAAAYAYIRAHPQIWEVILTGGDPLVLPASRLAQRGRRARRHRPRQDRPHTYPRAHGGAGTHHRRSDRCHQGPGQGDLCRASCQPSPRIDAACARGLRADRRRRHSDAEPVGAAQGRQRRCRSPRGADARLRRVPHQAVLSPPCRSRARHRAICAPRSKPDRS